ncbi:MAG: hypothetical protein ACK5KT_11860 [Dysgonomonas sp.]
MAGYEWGQAGGQKEDTREQGWGEFFSAEWLDGEELGWEGGGSGKGRAV